MTQRRKDRGTTILIIDDQPANLAVLVDYLEGRDIDVVVAENGKNGLARADYVLPDLILLDVLLPDINGFDTCRQLKTNRRTSAIPVIFMTALADVNDKISGFAAGGVDYVTKPLELEEVCARIKTHLTLNRLQKELEAKNRELTTALAEIDTLKGILPLCSFCKKIRDDQGYWQQVDAYIQTHTSAEISHSLCPDCLKEHYPDIVAPEDGQPPSG